MNWPMSGSTSRIDATNSRLLEGVFFKLNKMLSLQLVGQILGSAVTPLSDGWRLSSSERLGNAGGAAISKMT